MGAFCKNHITMLINDEQENAIRNMFKEKNWPCLLNVVPADTVTDIIASGFTDVFPNSAESKDTDDDDTAFREIKSEVMSIDNECSSSRDCQSTSVKHEAPKNSEDEFDYNKDETTDDDGDVSEENEGKSFPTGKAGVKKSCLKRSSTKRLKVDNGTKAYKNTARRVKCPLCDLELASKSILKRHCLRRHPDEWFEFECADCPSMFKTQEELWKHRDEVKHEPPKKTPKQFEKSKHTPEELREMGHLQCNACGKFFHNDRMLRKHLYYAHRDLMPVPVCAVCDTQFKTRQELWKHKKETNHNDCVSLLKHYQCDSCGKVLKGGYYSFIHHKKLACGKEEKELEELKVLPCDICGSTFKTKHQIQCHKKAVHLNAPEVCDVCGNVYKNQLALRAHKKRHDERNRKYSCKDCGRSFFNSTLLKQHIRTHTKEKPFKCPMCSYTSACKENIGKHTLSVHKTKAKAIDLRKQKLSDPVSSTGDTKGDNQCVARGNEELAFETNNAEKREEQHLSRLQPSSEPSSGSYIELMNCDVNPQTYMQSHIDPVQYQFPWVNPTRR